MNFNRIKTILLHAWYHTSHSMETWIDLVWFTLFETISFGFISTYFSQNNLSVGNTLMMGLFFWEIVRIGQYTITVGVMWEVWSKSFSSLFISPLKLKEYMIGQMLAGSMKILAVCTMIAVLSAIFFNFNILSLGPVVLLYGLILTAFSYALGLFITGIILRFGTDIQSLAWGLIFLLQPFSAIFYPLEILPIQIRWIAYFSPITFVMESARSQVFHGSINWLFVFISLILTTIYFIGSYYFLENMYQRSRKVGSFARLGN